MRRGVVSLWSLWLLVGCASKPPPTTTTTPVKPTGDLYRFRGAAGEKRHAKVKLSIEHDITRGQKTRHIMLNLQFSEEEKIESISPDGVMSVSARLVDALGLGSSDTDQKLVDDFALALDELKIQFKRTARGEVTALVLAGIRKPLEESTARAILNAMYGAGRGPLFPETPIDVGAKWNEAAPANSAGLAGQVRYDYTLSSKANGVATVDCQGKIDLSGAAQKIAGTISSAYRFELENGRIVSNAAESSTLVTENGQPALKQHLTVKWELGEK